MNGEKRAICVQIGVLEHRALRMAAARSGRFQASIVREALKEWLERNAPWAIMPPGPLPGQELLFAADKEGQVK